MVHTGPFPTLPRELVPDWSRAGRRQPPLLHYGWKLDFDKVLAFAKESGIAAYSNILTLKDDITDEDPADITPDLLGPESRFVVVRTFSSISTIIEVLTWFLNELEIEAPHSCPIQSVVEPRDPDDMGLTVIFAVYTNYQLDDAPSDGELEALQEAMDDMVIGDLRWWFNPHGIGWNPPGSGIPPYY